MLRKLRVGMGIFMLLVLTLLFVDVTGVAHTYLGWAAKLQFLPALLAVNFFVVVGLLLLTFALGRIYCSVVCPLGIMQDVFAFFGRKAKKNRYSYSPAVTWLRLVMLGLLVVAVVAGGGAVVALLAPYSAYGRIAANLFQPVYAGINNLLALAAERVDSYAFYSADVWIRSVSTFVIAAITFVVLGVLAWRNGRTYCNTICPVGTILGYVSRFSLFTIAIDHDKCKHCGKCARNCKAACINAKAETIDGTRCVVCFDCIDNCSFGAIGYRWRRAEKPAKAEQSVREDKEEACKAGDNATATPAPDAQKRAFLTMLGATAVGVASAQKEKIAEKLTDGGIITLDPKVAPHRTTPLVPAGSRSLRNFQQRCTGCQLCVANCPEQVLRPSSDITRLMQPEMSFERGFCRPSCNRCSQVCPSGPIKFVEKADKSSIQIGHAVWVSDRCVVNTDGVACGNCARHCPAQAITMVHSVPGDNESPLIPAVNENKCVGCGACEHVCPSRPIAAIYVEGHEEHKFI